MPQHRRTQRALAECVLHQGQRFSLWFSSKVTHQNWLHYLTIKSSHTWPINFCPQTNISYSKTVLFLEEATLTPCLSSQTPVTIFVDGVAKAAMGNFQRHFALCYLLYTHSSLLNLLSVCKTWKWIKPLDVVAVPRISNVAEGLEGRASV